MFDNFRLRFENLKMFFWDYSFIMNKLNQKPTDIFNKQDITVYFVYQNIKRLKYTKFLTSNDLRFTIYKSPQKHMYN